METYELSPPILYELGLKGVVEWLAETMKKQNGIQISIEDDGQSKTLDADILSVLFQSV